MTAKEGRGKRRGGKRTTEGGIGVAGCVDGGERADDSSRGGRRQRLGAGDGGGGGAATVARMARTVSGVATTVA